MSKLGIPPAGRATIGRKTCERRSWIGIAFSDDLYRLIERASEIHQTITNHQLPPTVKAAVIAQWAPPLSVAHASGPARTVIETPRAAYSASAKPEEPAPNYPR